MSEAKPDTIQVAVYEPAHTAEVTSPEPYKCEYNEDSKGNVRISVGARHSDPKQAVKICSQMYDEACKELARTGAPPGGPPPRTPGP